MKFKNILIVLILCILCFGCISAIYAVSDGDINNDVLQNQADVNSVSIDENEGIVSVSQDESVLTETNTDAKVGATSDKSASLSPYKKFCKDLEENSGTVYLTGNIKVKKPFVIKHKTVIDGNGYTIDGQHKTIIFKSSSSLTLKNIILKNGKASDRGGAVYSNGDLKIVNCKFINNQAKNFGGAIAMIKGHLTISNSKFQKNSVQNSGSSGYGGALWIFSSTSKIKKTIFKSNSCISKSLKSHSKATKYKFNGGVIFYNKGSSHSLSNCKFTGNKASNHGGVMFVARSPLKIDKCTFINNKARYEDGGAISFSGKKLTITNSNFKKNLAYEDGGAIDSYTYNGKKIYITIKKTVFNSNTGYKCGGAIWMGLKTSYNVVNSKFIKNKASSAGAVEAEDGSSKFTKCTFTSNKAAKVTSWTVKTKSGGHLAHSGGAILIKNKCTILKSVFKKNKATWGKSVKVEGGRLISKGNKGI